MLPGLATVGGVVDTAILLRCRQAAERTDVDAIGVCRIDQDATDTPAFGQAHVLPRLPAVGRLVHTVAGYIDVTDRPCLTGSRPDCVRLGWSDRQRANRCGFLIIEDGLPLRATIRGLE